MTVCTYKGVLSFLPSFDLAGATAPTSAFTKAGDEDGDDSEEGCDGDGGGACCLNDDDDDDDNDEDSGDNGNVALFVDGMGSKLVERCALGVDGDAVLLV